MDYKEILKGIVNIIHTTEKSDVGFVNICNYIGENCPELKENEDEMIRKDVLAFIRRQGQHIDKFKWHKWIAWLEKQDEIDLDHYRDGENEKRKFVGYGFLKCKGDFLSFKEGETYWLEYVGNDNYNVRSDNLLGQTFHIKPVELYTVFRPTTWIEKQGEQKAADKVEPN